MVILLSGYSGRSGSNEARKCGAGLRPRQVLPSKSRRLKQLTHRPDIGNFDAISCLVCLAEMETRGYKPASQVGAWLSPVEHCVRDAGVAGSNPAAPTILSGTSVLLSRCLDLSRDQIGSRPAPRRRACARGLRNLPSPGPSLMCEAGPARPYDSRGFSDRMIFRCYAEPARR